jgi:primosomal protein N' (replication factor Y)
VAELLSSVGRATAKDVCYYTGATMPLLKRMEKKGILTFDQQEVFRRPEMADVPPAAPAVLNEEQQTACDQLTRLCDGETAACALLYGVTGSGKTQVYLHLIRHVLDQGKTALVLVPEIALTPQLLRVFAAHFGDAVAVLHSSLSAGERYDEWKRARNGDAKVVVGTRSAVFAPLDKLGLIVLDEEQEGSYKSENVPRYHARDVAKYRCAQSRALLVLGSATPSVETMYQAKSGVYHLATMTRRYNERALPKVVIADLKEELREGNNTTISAPLREELEQNLRRGEQSILFINRRGTSRMVTCVECGEVPECPRCTVKLTYHKANGRLMCHYCGHSEALPDRCPKCGAPLSFVGAGTQKVQEELKALFPKTEVIRMDTDTVSAKQGHEKLLTRFEQEKVPILVGTQMVAKGLDFENVTLVGVIDADLSLYVDDFRAGERTFSLLTQVVGRAGRGARTGRAVIQTCTPENDVITCAARQDYDRFYESEVLSRRLRGYPPFRDLYILTASGPEEGAVLRSCMRLRDGLESWKKQPGLEDLQILGPAAANVVKVNNRYRYRLTVCCENKPAVRAMIAYLLRAAHEDKLNRGVSVYADLNPLD